MSWYKPLSTLISSLNSNKVYLQGDSTVVVAWLTSPVCYRLFHLPLFHDILEWKHSFTIFSVSHFCREGNQADDRAARHALQGDFLWSNQSAVRSETCSNSGCRSLSCLNSCLFLLCFTSEWHNSLVILACYVVLHWMLFATYRDFHFNHLFVLGIQISSLTLLHPAYRRDFYYYSFVCFNSMLWSWSAMLRSTFFLFII